MIKCTPFPSHTDMVKWASCSKSIDISDSLVLVVTSTTLRKEIGIQKAILKFSSEWRGYFGGELNQASLPYLVSSSAQLLRGFWLFKSFKIIVIMIANNHGILYHLLGVLIIIVSCSWVESHKISVFRINAVLILPY